MSGLFDPFAPKIYTIPAGANFLDELARQLAAETGLKYHPEALADALIYVPNRRSERALAFALYKASGREACLLPDIRALGDLESDDPPPSAEAALADLPPAISPANRIGGLTRLVLEYFQRIKGDVPASSALAAARELASLLDQAALSGDVDWQNLKDLVPELQLAAHWERSVDFLKIITDYWPAKLEEAAALDPYARRYAAAEALVEHWQKAPPQAPVIVAGSTGATPASRLLMRAALDLPKGLVVLPGLDRALNPATQRSVAETPSHPQFTMVRALGELGIPLEQVASWPGKVTSTARQRLIHEALAPAQSTADWTERLADIAEAGDVKGFVQQATEGLTLIEAADDGDEALIAALLLRETLEHDGETAALVTPDAGLARHVSAMLKRWQIEVAPSAGWPLSQTDAGSLALLVSNWLLDPSHPVALMAILNHPDSRFDADAVLTLDRHFLRGPRRWEDWTGLINHITSAGEPERQKYASYTVEDIQVALGLMSEISVCLMSPAIGMPIEGQAWYEVIAAQMGEIAVSPRPWSGDDGAALSKLLQDMAELAEPLGPQMPDIWNELLASEAARITMAAGEAHPRLAIWGPLEARLQTADRIILAGLNEGVWPAQPPADSFLPRVFRKKIGLSDPDERVGLSAHDFAQLAAAPNVTLLSSLRRDDKPAVASRWLWRLKTLTRGALGDGATDLLGPDPDHDPVDWLKALEAAPALPGDFTAEPQPRPPIEARPKQLSVTRVEQLVRDPYAIYAESVLGLRKLDALNLPPDVRIRGTAIHKALERFEELSVGDGEVLLGLLEEELRLGGEPEADIIALRERRREVCAAYLEWRQETAHRLVGAPITEEKGESVFRIAGEAFTLTGTADRIERRESGIAILDFKSGKPPTEKQVRSGLSPQMPLQGLIARRGGYRTIGEAEVEALTYVRFGTAFEVQELGAGNSRTKLEPQSTKEMIDEVEAGLIRLLTQFADPEHPYLSAPRPERVIYESDYTRLARRDEWTGLDTFDD